MKKIEKYFNAHKEQDKFGEQLKKTIKIKNEDIVVSIDTQTYPKKELVIVIRGHYNTIHLPVSKWEEIKNTIDNFLNMEE